MSTQASSATIKVNLPMGILGNAKNEAQRIGISVQDFIRMLMATYFARDSLSAIVRDAQLYERARQDLQAGRYTTIRTKAELEKHFSKLNK